MLRCLLIGWSMLVLWPRAVEAQENPKQAAPSAARLVTFDELRPRLEQPGLRLLDVRSRADYDQGHLPGAVWVDTRTAPALAGRPGGLDDRDAWAAWLAPLGIGPKVTEVLIVDGARQFEAARVWWLLTYLGVPNVGLVDGNVPLWVQQGRPMTTTVSPVSPSNLAISLRRDRLATREDVLGALKGGTARVVDARSVAEHTGERKASKRGGHIPTACLLEWTELVAEDGRFLSTTAVRERLATLGIKPDEAVITHCQVGGRAAVAAFAIERLGVSTRNYFLGWSDWGNAENTPIATGRDSAPKPQPESQR